MSLIRPLGLFEPRAYSTPGLIRPPALFNLRPYSTPGFGRPPWAYLTPGLIRPPALFDPRSNVDGVYMEMITPGVSGPAIQHERQRGLFSRDVLPAPLPPPHGYLHALVWLDKSLMLPVRISDHHKSECMDVKEESIDFLLA